ncbi:Brp/Blh family beta-carotene 15,15'-dioxygenase [Sphingomonas sp. LR55]
MNHHRVLIGRGGVVPAAFWLAGVYLVTAFAAQLPLDGPTATTIATLVFVAGGLPHGAYDIALLARSTRLRSGGLGLAVMAYIGVAATMAVLWLVAPVVALILFLIVAAIHFGEDWTMIDEPLLRMAAGTAIIAAPAIGNPATVAQLFVSMAGGPGGEVVAQAMIALAPVALLVTGVGIGVAWREGARVVSGDGVRDSGFDRDAARRGVRAFLRISAFATPYRCRSYSAGRNVADNVAGDRSRDVRVRDRRVAGFCDARRGLADRYDGTGVSVVGGRRPATSAVVALARTAARAESGTAVCSVTADLAAQHPIREHAAR